MTKKFWKTWMGHRIYQSSSLAEVYQNPFFRWLTLGSNALQTLIHRHHLEKPGLKYIEPLTYAIRAQPGDCCILGLGGASVAHALSPFVGNAALVAVEHNLEIISIAKTYFYTALLKNLSIIHQDAYLFLQQQQQKYAHLIVDLFNADSFPEHCNNTVFFSHCSDLLLADGILAVNIANTSERGAIVQHIRQSFHQNTVCIPVKGCANMIVLAIHGNSIIPLLKKIKQQGNFKKIVWDSKWGYVAEMR